MQGDKEIQRTRLKLTAAYRADFRLKQRFEYIDFDLDVLKPELEKLESGLAAGHFPLITIEEVPVKRPRLVMSHEVSPGRRSIK